MICFWPLYIRFPYYVKFDFLGDTMIELANGLTLPLFLTLPIKLVFFSLIVALTVLLFSLIVRFMRPYILVALKDLAIEPKLDRCDKVWIFILVFIAPILTISSLGILGDLVRAFGITAVNVLLIFATVVSLLGSLWWLLGFMLWPWDRRFWQFYDRSKSLAFLLGGVLIVAPVGGIALAQVAGDWVLVGIGVMVLLLWAGIVWRCSGIVLWQKVVQEFVEWVEEKFTVAYEFYEETLKQVQGWEQRQIKQVGYRRRNVCSSWHWLFRWLCLVWETLWEAIVVLGTIAVKVVLWIVELVLVIVQIAVSILIFVIVPVVVFLPKLIFWCWQPKPPLFLEDSRQRHG